MRQVIEAIEPALWVAYGVARAHRSDVGEWPEVPHLARQAENSQVDPWALIIMTRAELPELDREKMLTGRLVRFDDRDVFWRPTVLAPTPDALVALYLMAAELYADVVDPWGRRVVPRDLHAYATDWTEAANATGPGVLVDFRIEPPSLPISAEH